MALNRLAPRPLARSAGRTFLPAPADRTAVLETALDARTDAERVELALSVENAGDEPVTLAFPDARRAEFVARVDDEGDGVDDSDEEAWRWSRGRLFAQSLGEVTLRPGEGRTFEATWEGPEPGTYRIEAELAAADAAPAAETTVTVPA